MADALCDRSLFERGEVTRKRFPDGERYLRIETESAGRDIVLVGGTITDSDTLEIYDLACALVKYGARRLSLVIPYYGYSTMERATRAGEVVGAKTRARLLSSIPRAANGNRVFMMDLHKVGIAHYFEGGIRPVHFHAKSIIEDAARRMGGNDFVLACTDAGRAKWVESLAHRMGVDVAFVYKRRLDGNHTEVAGVSAHVAGKVVVIYDDMIRTGGSLLGAAQAYADAGATDVYAIATHGVFPGNAIDTLTRSGIISSIVCTDTHPHARSLASDFLTVAPVAPLLATQLEGTP